MKNIIKRYRIDKVSSVVAGGKTRAGSVKNCFKAIKMPCDIVLIHDGARPFLSERLIRSSIISASRYGACITAVPQTDTVKLAGKDLFVKRTLDRSGLWRAQTPQAFKYGILRKAVLASDRSGSITDDASMVERAGKKARIIEGDARNIKVTTKEDLKMAEVLLCA
jgi:2-C-methyl-D-erythritol 4-phosphate cytidylyltransferase